MERKEEAELHLLNESGNRTTKNLEERLQEGVLEKRIEMRSPASTQTSERESPDIHLHNTTDSLHTNFKRGVTSSGTTHSSSPAPFSTSSSSSPSSMNVTQTPITTTSKSILLAAITSTPNPILESPTSPLWILTNSTVALGEPNLRLTVAVETANHTTSVNASYNTTQTSTNTITTTTTTWSTDQNYHQPLQPTEAARIESSTQKPPLTTRTSRNSSKAPFAKRRAQSNDSKAQRSSTPKSQPQSLLGITPEDVLPNPCDDEPCGPYVSCHPTPGGEYAFDCICSNLERIRPGGNCDIEELGIIPSLKPIPSKTYKHNDQSRNLIGSFLAAFVLLVILLIYWRRKTLLAFLRHRHRDKKSASSPGALAKSSSLLTYNFASNPNYYAQAPDNLPLQTLAVQLIDKEQITFVGELGEGCFGKVYKGEYGPRCPENLAAAAAAAAADGSAGGGGGSSSPTGVSVTVAVKVLKDGAGVDAETDFMSEVEIMSAFRHENILSLIGIVATETGGTPWIVFEYMPYGDLAEVLRNCNKQFYVNDPPVKSLGKEDLLNMSVQIASGMNYLSSQHFVHRDLACRNCLVGENLCVKISDFGMSRDVYTCDYYKVGGTRMLPVRWMAPESIMFGKFTLESDVWSFGVVLWEMYSFGKQPYYGNSNEHVVKLILQGILLSPPDTCPAQVCDVMRRCWATEPHDRIKFPDILTSLTRILHGHSDINPLNPPSTPGASITYSELCMHDEDLQLDNDQYLMPKKVEHREYLTVLSDV